MLLVVPRVLLGLVHAYVERGYRSELLALPTQPLRIPRLCFLLFSGNLRISADTPYWLHTCFSDHVTDFTPSCPTWNTRVYLGLKPQSCQDGYHLVDGVPSFSVPRILVRCGELFSLSTSTCSSVGSIGPRRRVRCDHGCLCFCHSVVILLLCAEMPFFPRCSFFELVSLFASRAGTARMFSASNTII